MVNCDFFGREAKWLAKCMVPAVGSVRCLFYGT